MLTDVPTLNQVELKNMLKFGIRSGANILILGPSGGGKTFMAMQVADEEECDLIYVNLSVLERTDFQGMPVISHDKTLVTYATPEFLPFSDTKARDEIATLSALKNFVQVQDTKDEEKQKAYKAIESRINDIYNDNHLAAVKNGIDFVESLPNVGKKLAKAVSSVNTTDKDERPIVFLFDEVDKAAHEVLQTLLEFLQFHSVNGRKMQIKSCILTGNLPDEFANSAQISHAITKRCMTYKLELDFNQWREWAFDNGIHEHVVAFLTGHNNFLHKGPPDGDPTAYALPSPRTWTSASDGLKMLDTDPVFKKLSPDQFNSLRIQIVAGNVGETAAVQFNNWLQHYRELDPVVYKLVEEGVFPDTKRLDVQKTFICALSSCSKVYASLKPNNEETIKKYAKNVYKWIKTLPPDVQMGAVRMSFGGDWENIKKYQLASIPEFVEVFKLLKAKLEGLTDK